MRRRADRLARLARAQGALARAAELKSAEANAALRSAQVDADEIIRALNDDSPLHGLIVPQMAEALSRNAKRTHGLAATSERAESAARTEARRAERLAELAASEAKSDRARRERLSLEAKLCETAFAAGWPSPSARRKPASRQDS